MTDHKPAEEMTPNELLAHAQELMKVDAKESLDEAERIIEFLLGMDRDNRGLVFFLGTIYMRMKRYAVAEHWLRRALDMDSDEPFAEAWNNLGFVLDAEGRKTESIEAFKTALSIKETSEFLNNIGTSYVNNGTPDEAIAWCERALEKDPNNKDAKWNRGLAYLEKGDWERGWDGYHYGLQLDPGGGGKRKYRNYAHDGQEPTPLWEGTAGKSVAIYGEQGVGDEILAASMLPDAAKDAQIIYEAHPRLVNIMRHAYGNRWPIYGTRKEEHIDWPNWHPVQAKLPILSLGKFYRRRDEDFPRTAYLKPFDDAVERSRARLAELGPKLKIGVSWKGGTVITRHDLRSLPLQYWMPIFESIDAEWVSLQYDPAPHPGRNAPIVKMFEEQCGVHLHHWPEVINDLDECYGGLIHALDLIVTVNTSLVHACGAYGVPCWVMTPSRPAWRYGLTGTRMAWYGDWVTQFRQEDDDWEGLVQLVARNLRDWYEEVTAA